MSEIQIDLVEGKKKYTAQISLVEKWDDVPAAVYPELCSVYLKKPEEMDVYDKTVRAFVLLTLPHFDVVKRLQDEELYELLKLIDWVFNRLDLVKNIQASITIDNLTFHGPSDEMENLRFAEWCVADTYFVNYARTGDINNLHMLAACIYRPAGEGVEYSTASSLYRGDIREKFNDQLLPYRKQIMAKLTTAQLHGIYVFFASCKHKITGMYPAFFPKPNKADCLLYTSDAADER
nr:hypothetical protein [Pedobacter sp. ASV19]